MITMACTGCGKRRMHAGLPPAEQPRLGPSGVYDLLTAETSTRYNGRFRSMDVHIVGFRTEHERVFPGNHGKAARAYALEVVPGTKLRMFKALASRIPHDVGLAVFGG